MNWNPYRPKKTFLKELKLRYYKWSYIRHQCKLFDIEIKKLKKVYYDKNKND